MGNPKEVIKVVDQLYKPFKEAIENYPNAFSVIYVEGQGYILTIDLDFLEQVQEGQV